MNEKHNESDEKLQVAYSAKNEIEATVVLNAMNDAGIQAMLQGQHTGSFRAENWTDVLVVVREQDMEAAKQVVAKMTPVETDVDWGQVDVGEPED